MWLRPSCVPRKQQRQQREDASRPSARASRHATSTSGAASDAGSARGPSWVCAVFPVLFVCDDIRFGLGKIRCRSTACLLRFGALVGAAPADTCLGARQAARRECRCPDYSACRRRRSAAAPMSGKVRSLGPRWPQCLPATQSSRSAGASAGFASWLSCSALMYATIAQRSCGATCAE